jgi:adenosine deaminase
MQQTINQLIREIPKAELHLHIEGTFEPEQMFAIAKRNNKRIKFQSIEELKEAYQFNNLQDFLDIYYEGANVLIEEDDFFEMTWNYLEKMHQENVKHVEIFFDPQTHTDRSIPFEKVVNGIHKALQKAEIEFAVSSKLIMCFLRHLDSDSAMNTLNQALKYLDKIYAVGLDSSEIGNPPIKFKEVFKKARAEGLLTVAHAGEEGPAEYVWEAINELKVSRIDHGNNALNDPKLIEYLVANRMPLTVCPLSNLKLQVVKDLTNHPLKQMLQLGLKATINSDDPAYFGGYLTENYIAITKALNLNESDIKQLAINSFEASFLNEAQKQTHIQAINNL